MDLKLFCSKVKNWCGNCTAAFGTRSCNYSDQCNTTESTHGQCIIEEDLYRVVLLCSTRLMQGAVYGYVHQSDLL